MTFNFIEMGKRLVCQLALFCVCVNMDTEKAECVRNLEKY